MDSSIPPEVTPELMEQAEDVLELMEDTVSFYCDEARVSGEKVWLMVRTLADCKIADFPNDFTDNITH